MQAIAGHQAARRVLTAPPEPADVLYDWFTHQWWSEDLYLALASSKNALTLEGFGFAVAALFQA
jgi:hypothetical protein